MTFPEEDKNNHPPFNLIVMKTYAISIAIFMLSSIEVPARIINGYEPEIQGAWASLNRLDSLLRDNQLPFVVKARMRKSRDRLLSFVTYHEVTENVLHKFEEIAPEIFQEIEAITDRKGRPVTVFVKLVSETEMQKGIGATTNLEQEEADPDAYRSEYGINTVSVRISACRKSYLLLAHELGHVRYQVRNLAVYAGFHAENYQDYPFASLQKGHNPKDPSGRSAREYERKFRRQYARFRETNHDKTGNPAFFSQMVKKDIRQGSL